ncbi:MAG: hypothetical protein H0U74_07845 [Bradymonadaceae bacterium]|nr:hypothetical protein [Lujinxingiaceae bacterium]
MPDDNSKRSSASVAPIERLVTQLALRIRLGRAIDWAISGACVALLIGALVLALVKTGWVEPEMLERALRLIITLPLWAALLSMLKRLDRIALAQQIDQAHNLQDRLSTALSLARSGVDGSVSTESDFARAQIDDALRHTASVKILRAAPVRRPADIIPFVLFVAGIAGLWAIPMVDHVKELPPAPVIQHAQLLDTATIAIERSRLEEIKRQLEERPDIESKELIEEIEALLLAVEKREISEREFLERIEQIEEKFFKDRKPDPIEELADALKEAADELRKEAGGELAQQKEFDEVIKALEKKDLAEAAKAMDKLAEKLLNQDLSAKEAEQLAKLLEKFADKLDLDSPKMQELMDKHQKTLEDLAKKFENQAKPSAAEKQRLDKAKEDLAKAKQRQRIYKDTGTGRKLQHLQKEAEKMAEDLKKHAEQQKSAGKKKSANPEDADYKNEVGRNAKRAASELEEQSREQKTSDAKEAARQQLEEMREAMKRSESRSSESKEEQRRGEQVKDFLERAKGEQEARSDKEMENSKGEQGAEQQGKNDPTQGDGKQQKPEEAGKSGEGSKGEEGGEKGEGSGDAEAGDKRDDGPPKGHSLTGPNTGGEQDETKLDSKRVKEQATGDKGAGQSRSEIIRGASEEGFATTEYKDVYGDYSSVVEEVMEREKVPAGYRYYIKRYFQLIKPQQ